MRHPLLTTLLSGSAAAALVLSPASAQSTTRVTVDAAGAQANADSAGSSISADGRFVAFASNADNLVAGDTNGVSDVFVHDRQTGQTRRVSVDSAGVQGDGASRWPAISADGHTVAFDSEATNLVPGDTQGFRDVFVHNLTTGKTYRVSVNPAGVAGTADSRLPSISATGRYVAYESYANNLVHGDTRGYRDVFVTDRDTGLTARASVNSNGQQANDSSSFPCISANGRVVSFSSAAVNLVTGDGNGVSDVFVFDRQTAQTTRVSVDSAGAEADDRSSESSLSADGRFVAFDSLATNLAAGDTNLAADVFLHDRQSGLTTRVSVSSGGAQGGGASHFPSLSADGQSVAFHSHAPDLVPGDGNAVADVFVRVLQSGLVTRVSVNSAGAEGNDHSEFPSLSADGRSAAFSSWARNLVPGDRNGHDDVFVYERGGNGPVLAKSGSCPGQVALTVTDVASGGFVAVVRGLAGNFIKPSPPCQGMHIDISLPTLQSVASAGPNGVAVLTFNAPAGICGLAVQAIDVTNCLKSNVIVF